MTSKILCPVDYSAPSEAALDNAVALAGQTGATLLVAHVELPSTPPLGMAEPPRERESDQQRALAARVAQLCGEGKKAVPYELRVLRGDPAAEIIRLAGQEKAELIVMATAGRSGWRRMLMGSVAETVVRDAPCPVLSFKQPLDDASAPGGASRSASDPPGTN